MTTSVSPLDQVPKKLFAEWLNLTTRQVSNLQDAGLPVEVKGPRVYVRWPEGLHWYIRRLKESPAAADEKSKELHTRLKEIEVALAEIKLSEEQGNVVTLDYMEAQLAGALERLRARLLNTPGKYAPSIVGLRTIAEAQTRMEAIIAEAMLSLSETGEDPDLDEDDAGDAR